MDGLIAFMCARLDDDERYARLFLALGQRLKDNPPTAVTEVAKAGIGAILGAPEAAAEAMRWKCRAPNDLERVLSEVEAKRAHVRAWERAALGFRTVGETEREFGAREALEAVLEADAAVWSDHPDYRPGWKP